VIDTSLDYVSTPNSYPFNQKNCWVLKKKDKQGPSLAPQVNPECLGAQAGRTLSAVKRPRLTPLVASQDTLFDGKSDTSWVPN
jgi:hypothetical protein